MAAFNRQCGRRQAGEARAATEKKARKDRSSRALRAVRLSKQPGSLGAYFMNSLAMSVAWGWAKMRIRATTRA